MFQSDRSENNNEPKITLINNKNVIKQSSLFYICFLLKRMQSQQIEIINEKGYKLQAYLELPSDHPARHYAIFAHCFTCNSNFGAVRNVCTSLAAHGIAVVRFDFTGLGRSEGTFAESHFSANVSDLLCVAEYLKKHFKSPELLIGHSLGGAAVIAAAATLSEVKAVATIGTPYRVDHVQKQFRLDADNSAPADEWEINIGGRPFTINKLFLAEMQKTDLHTILNRLHVPIIFLHAPGDTIVGIENATSLFQSSLHPKSFISLDTADHLLSDRKDSLYAGNTIAAWAARYLPE
jgi:pimeloyl-ACP methyl ester carboxylesterase